MTASSSTRPAVVRHRAAAVCTLLAAVAALPDLLFGLDRSSPFAQLVSFRPWILAGGLAVLVALLPLVPSRRRLRPFVAGPATVLLVGAALLLPRVVPDPVPVGGVPLTVLAFNTYEGAADAGELAAVIRAERPDVIAVVEAGEGFRARLAPLVEPLGYRLHVTAADDSDVGNVIAVVAGHLGDVRVRVGDEAALFPYVEVTGGGLGALRVVAFHAAAPVVDLIGEWQADLALLRQWCAGPTPAVVAGDFNATLDHSALRDGTTGCADAAAQRGAGLVPTWGPTPRTRVFGPQIDHVFATRGIVAETFSVHDITGSDHRAVLTRLRLPT